ncbi:MAG TPA: DUF2934 domain-containing protein [Longimicrobium sp.]|nr:DUF2934 domain-containing protein [Longimicrobium sp.]
MQTTGRDKKGTEKSAGATTGGTPRGTGNEVRPAGRPTHEEIARRAYELFIARGGTHGRHEEDWYQALRELQSRR